MMLGAVNASKAAEGAQHGTRLADRKAAHLRKTTYRGTMALKRLCKRATELTRQFRVER